jgi:hypothetical protein
MREIKELFAEMIASLFFEALGPFSLLICLALVLGLLVVLLLMRCYRAARRTNIISSRKPVRCAADKTNAIQVRTRPGVNSPESLAR